MAPGVALAVVALAQVAAAPTLRPEVALASARAEAEAGSPHRARDFLLRALPHAGPLADLLRWEIAKLELKLGRDPYPFLAPLLRPPSPMAFRQAAAELTLRAVRELPLTKATPWWHRPLPAPLRRQVRAILALRRRDFGAAFRLLAENPTDRVAGELALGLREQVQRTKERELVARALFTAGFWQEAREVLSRLPPASEEEFAVSFLRARTAYRLELWEEAILWFERAEKAATSTEDRLSCWLYAARAHEQRGRESCAEELYRRMVAAKPDAVEGWTGLLFLLSRRQGGWPAVAALDTAPPSVRRELAPRLCAGLVTRGQLAAAGKAAAFGASGDPALTLCQGFVAWHMGEGALSQKLFATVIANPQAGKLRELAALALPLHLPGAQPTPTRNLGELAQLAVTGGLETARHALLLSLRNDPELAPVVTGPVSLPPLPQPVAALVETGFSRDIAVFLPHLLPRSSPRELAWSAVFLAQAGNLRDAAELGERVWRILGPVPASLLPDELLPVVLPQALATPVPPQAGPLRPLLVALARQESRFDRQAFSPTGARGLWQLMPATTAKLAVGEEDDDGTLALRHLWVSAKSFGADPLPLAAAYNAGDSWVKLWLEEGAGPHPLFPLAVPYSETRAYLMGVVEGLFLARYLK
ncbi:MAG: transglycosylase SLT domain-containing protein [Thermoanaerobaculum sp.]